MGGEECGRNGRIGRVGGRRDRGGVGGEGLEGARSGRLGLTSRVNDGEGRTVLIRLVVWCCRSEWDVGEGLEGIADRRACLISFMSAFRVSGRSIAHLHPYCSQTKAVLPPAPLASRDPTGQCRPIPHLDLGHVHTGRKKQHHPSARPLQSTPPYPCPHLDSDLHPHSPGRYRPSASQTVRQHSTKPRWSMTPPPPTSKVGRAGNRAEHTRI